MNNQRQTATEYALLAFLCAALLLSAHFYLDSMKWRDRATREAEAADQWRNEYARVKKELEAGR